MVVHHYLNIVELLHDYHFMVCNWVLQIILLFQLFPLRRLLVCTYHAIEIPTWQDLIRRILLVIWVNEIISLTCGTRHEGFFNKIWSAHMHARAHAWVDRIFDLMCGRGSFIASNKWGGSIGSSQAQTPNMSGRKGDPFNGLIWCLVLSTVSSWTCGPGTWVSLQKHGHPIFS